MCTARCLIATLVVALSTMQGKSRCQFDASESIASVAGFKHDLHVVDLDGDEDMDLVLAGVGGAVCFTQDSGHWKKVDLTNETARSVAVLDRNGSVAVAGAVVDIYASTSVVSSIDVSAIAIAAIDADGDGDSELAVLTAEGVIVYDDGLPVLETSLSGGVALAAGDFDGDGAQDLTVAANNELYYLANPTFEPLVVANSLLGLRTVHVADLVAVAGSYLDDTVTAVRMHQDEAAIYRVTESAHGVIAVFGADVDSDGTIDAVSACPDDHSIRKHTNRGDGHFDTTIVDADVTATAIAINDIDSDSSLDIIAATYDGVVVYRNLDCAPLFDENSKSSKKKKSHHFNVTVVVIFSVVATLALVAFAVFIWSGTRPYVPAIKSRVQDSMRRFRRRKCIDDLELSPPSSPQCLAPPPPARVAY